jgi:hypothetical protein
MGAGGAVCTADMAIPCGMDQGNVIRSVQAPKPGIAAFAQVK